ncbi:SNF2 family DNA or RNA helicase [Lysinibacillus composti]|uniref:Helicase SNF n=1 Tax=Lysinibacillus composti TaxID=720633 RepID=A0A3N9UF89_9BACI|nr:DEAD/DEAH box helicase [Lysinibacillus composti]MBM7608571.1 SNF2 family DNA or RNA helicase [Lysinibacillus composti]RQW74854.1 helicase SNF [Lysinibacillus composti]
MEIKVSHKIIKEMCGSVSFKRGESYYRANKVNIHDYNAEQCIATVKAAEDFRVTIKSVSGSIEASCSCPTLAGFSKNCQHVAAVLLAIVDKKKYEKSQTDAQVEQSNEHQLSNSFMTLFQDEPIRKSRHQLHFENRKVLEVQFVLKPCLIRNGQYLFGVQLYIDQTKISPIRSFLQHVKLGKQCTLSCKLNFDPNEHCFDKQDDVVLQYLIKVVRDEMVYHNALSKDTAKTIGEDVLLIPPSTWGELMPLLTKANSILVDQREQTQHLHLVEGAPPLQIFVESLNKEFQMTAKGFEKMLLFSAYNAVLSEGKVYQLDGDDYERLDELQEMLVTPDMNTVPIPREQIDIFLNKVVPSLRKISHVNLSEQLIEEMRRTPLVAKIYLDRLKNRLLVGLEFQYDHVVIQPLEKSEHPIGPMILRDYKKEQEILEILDTSGFMKTDGGYFMQNEELEFDFLNDVVPTLQPLAQIYATTAVRNRLVKKDVFPKIVVKLKKERTDWLEFKFKMDGISDEQVKEILQAIQVKRKYYRLPNDSLLSLNLKEMEEIRRFLLTAPIQDDDIETTFNMPILESLKFLELIDESEVFSPEESFRQLIDRLLHPETLDFEIPTSLEEVLRDYQIQGFKWMKSLASYGFGGVLADDMGLGKTVQSIAFIVSELENIKARKQQVLIVCPSSLTYNWLHEIMAFAPELQAIVIDGELSARKELLKSLDDSDISVLITSYPLIRRDLAWYEKQTFHTVFFDEAQAFKNPVTQTARAVKKIKADHRFALTGTPVENRAEELWSIYHVVFPQLFQGLEEYSFLTRKSISKRVRPFLLRRLKEEVLAELPGKNEELGFSELLPEQKKLYAAFLAKLRYDALKHLDKESFRENRIRILAGLTRLRQICCHPGLFVEGYKGGSAKFEQLLQILEESKHSGKRVLIFSQFTKMLELIGRELTIRNQPYFYLDGHTPSEKRVELCNRFNDGERDLFLISLKAGGTGLNLTGADTVILYDLWWNPAVEDQAMSRAHRMGQKNTVQVIKLLARGTIEEKMNELQEKKKNLIADIIEFDEKTSITLTEEEIREILMI